MRKFLKSALMGITISLIFVTPTFAATTNLSTYNPIKGDQVVTQGAGYKVIIPNGGKSATTKSTTTKSTGIMPMGLTGFTMGQGGSGTFSGSTSQGYANGALIDWSSIFVKDQHNLIGSDYMWAYGHQYVDYNGTVPWNADSYTFAPSETVTSSAATVTGVSIPGGVSISASYGSCTLNWLSQTINNNYKADYYWNQWETSTPGHFNSVSTNDQVTWRFGTTIIGQLNTVRVTLQ